MVVVGRLEPSARLGHQCQEFDPPLAHPADAASCRACAAVEMIARRKASIELRVDGLAIGVEGQGFQFGKCLLLDSFAVFGGIEGGGFRTVAAGWLVGLAFVDPVAIWALPKADSIELEWAIAHGVIDVILQVALLLSQSRLVPTVFGGTLKFSNELQSVSEGIDSPKGVRK